MKTLSIHKDKTSLASETVGKWWNSKNVFFSLLTEENGSVEKRWGNFLN